MEPKKITGKTRTRSAAREIAYIALSVALISVCAFITIPIGPISFTLQTLGVALVGGLMGWKRGTAAIVVYVLMGLIGIPVFSGFRAGMGALFGPTGGYIFGFLFLVLAPALFKKIPLKNKWARGAMLYGASWLGLAVCYFFGTVWFVLVARAEVWYAFTVCVLPFLLPDAVKLFISTLLTVRLERYVK